MDYWTDLPVNAMDAIDQDRCFCACRWEIGVISCAMHYGGVIVLLGQLDIVFQCPTVKACFFA